MIENAIFYTHPNGQVLIDCILKENRIIFFVSDTGIGLNMGEKIRIFSKFYRGKRATLMNTDGMGLTLYLAKMIVKRHNGEIYAKSKGENKGSTFFLELPLKK